MAQHVVMLSIPGLVPATWRPCRTWDDWRPGVASCPGAQFSLRYVPGAGYLTLNPNATDIYKDYASGRLFGQKVGCVS